MTGIDSIMDAMERCSGYNMRCDGCVMEGRIFCRCDLLKAALECIRELRKEGEHGEYIDREAVLKLARDGKLLPGRSPGGDEPPLVRDMINAIPAADVAPVRHGRWVDEKYVWQGQKSAQCNQCKRETGYYTQPEYCPHCGARMEENDA